ncbi:hypothetical protein FXF50_05030 [Micromonospora sp. AP08]|nr:hypothetical protein FXF50_05030 [Micromonospora sp. AP08]
MISLVKTLAGDVSWTGAGQTLVLLLAFTARQVSRGPSRQARSAAADDLVAALAQPRHHLACSSRSIGMSGMSPLGASVIRPMGMRPHHPLSQQAVEVPVRSTKRCDAFQSCGGGSGRRGESGGIRGFRKCSGHAG